MPLGLLSVFRKSVIWTLLDMPPLQQARSRAQVLAIVADLWPLDTARLKGCWPETLRGLKLEIWV